MARKAALITGGGTGVGRATVLQLAPRGYDVVINYSRSQADADVRAMLARCRSEFGRLDVLVNNAAITHFIDHTDLEAMTEEKWDRIFEVNLKGAFFVSRAAMPLLQASGNGAIVNVASVAGLAGAGSSIAYAASKGALITMTKSLARAFAPHVRVNAVCPGVIESRWLDDHPEMIQSAIKVTPLKRASTTDDIADVVTFLACDAGMMTGQALTVDGGRSM